MSEQDEDDAQDRSECQVAAHCSHTVGGVQPYCHERGQCRTEDGRHVVGDTAGGVTHVGGVQLRQVCGHGTEGQTHQAHADKDEEGDHCCVCVCTGTDNGGGDEQTEGQTEDRHRDGGPQLLGAAAVLVSQPTRDRDEDCEANNGDQLNDQELAVGDSQAALIRLADTVGENPRGHQVEQHIAGNHDEGALNHGPPSDLERLNERGLHLLVVSGSLGEDGGLLQLETNV